MKVKEIMHRDVAIVPAEKTVAEAAQLMAKSGIGILPVEENDKMIGMITDRDIAVRVVAEGLDAKKLSVKECMSRGVRYCYEEDDVKDLTNQMKTSKFRRIPVVNSDKRLVGIVSLKELIQTKNKTLTHDTLERICS